MKVELHFGDITKLEVDCMVNAAKPSLLGGGGGDGAIHKKADLKLFEFYKNLGGCKAGEAKISPAFNLFSDYIIHTVGSGYLFKSERERDLLKKCYISVFDIAKENKIKVIAFSNISTGSYGFPKELATKISLYIIFERISTDQNLEKAIICCLNK